MPPEHRYNYTRANIFSSIVALTLVGFSYYIASLVGPVLADFAIAHLR